MNEIPPPLPVEITTEQAEIQYPGPTEFVHLHNHTLFSLLDGVASPSAYFKACAERKWPALAVTEHGVLSSIPDCYFAAKEHKTKYLVGVEFYYNDYEAQRAQKANEKISINEIKTKGRTADGNRQVSEEFALRLTRNRHITVIAKNEIGYVNLLNINKEAYEKGFYRKPRTWFDLLAKYKEGLNS
jgi:DNA polymerase-3 subunit alpha